jgi:hopanoid biosynthesis associated RND transporter like protein HpnN
MHERLRYALLGTWGRAVSTHALPVVVVSVLLAVTCVVLAVLHLEFRPDRSDLVDPNISWNKAYARYKHLNERWGDLTVCLDGPADEPRVDQLAHSIALTLQADPQVISADAGFEVGETGPRLFRAAPPDVFDEFAAQLPTLQAVAQAENANAALRVLTQSAQDPADPAAAVDQLRRVLQPYTDACASREPSFDFLLPSHAPWQPLVSRTGSGRLRFIQVQFAADEAAGIDATSAQLTWLRDQVRAIVHDSSIAAQIDWGVTGIPAIEADETRQSIIDSTRASILSFITITVLLLVVFRGVVLPLIAAGALLIGLAWSFGWLVLSVGHLQLLSVVFTVILLGLGIDFAVHLVARLELVRDEHADLPSAVSRVFRGIGPGMVTGAVTTAAAFGATSLTKFKGMAEMGIIAGGGIILCLIAVLSLLPAGIALTGRWKKVIRHRPGGESAHFAHGVLDFVDRRPRRTLTLTGLAVALMFILALDIHYDPNVLNLHPPGIESVEWEKRIVEDDARSVWAALVWTTPTEAPDLVDRLRRVDGVSEVGGMGLLLPADRHQRDARVAAIRSESVTPPTAPASLDATLSTLALIQRGIEQFGAMTPSTDADDPLASLSSALNDARHTADDLSPEARHNAFERLNDAFLASRRELTSWLDEALAPHPLGPEDLPTFLRGQWAPTENQWLLMVFPDADPQGRSILHPQRLGPFVRSIRAAVGGENVNERVLGPPVQIYESSVLIQREYIRAAIMAVVAILVLLLIDFRSLADALAAMLPVTVGFIGMFGLMGLADEPVNFANIMVLPLIFGIGADAGVHMVHRWRQEPYGRPAGLSGGTGRGISLTMLTTMIGFGSMFIAEHRGIRSLGFVMVIGLGMTLGACYLVLPAVLRLRAAKPTEAMGFADDER